MFPSMEGSVEAMKPERGTTNHEKAKRKLKTPAQVEALEEFYNEHKYPSEAMKLEFAKRIGLSDKQVSGWFCHRRLKEKKTMEGEICTNGKQNLSSSGIHDRTSGIRQESCSSTKQVDRNLDSKEVESRIFYGCNSSAVVACEASNKHACVGHFDVLENRYSDSSSSASQGRFQQNNESLRLVQPSRCTLLEESCMLMGSKNTGIKRKGHEMNSVYSFLQEENETPAISAVKWKLGSHFQEDGPPLGFEFDPLPPGAFDSPVRDSKCEPYYVGDSMQHKFSGICRSIKKPSVYDKCALEKLSSKTYPEKRAFKPTKQGFNDCNVIELQSTKKAFISSHRKHVQYQTIVTDMVDNSASRTSSVNGRKTGYFKYKTEGICENKLGNDLHQDCSSSYIRNSFPYFNYDSQVFQGKHFDTTSLIGVDKMHASIGSEHRIQPQKSLKKKIRTENTQENHSLFQKEMLISNKNKASGKMNGVKFWQHQCAGKGLAKHERQVRLIRYPWDAGSNRSQDVSEGTSSSLDRGELLHGVENSGDI